MREIKFRAWATDEEKMYDDVIVTGGLIHLRWSEAGYEFSNFVSDWSDYYNKNVYTVMQYTGLKDANGVEIFEGDIIALEVIKGVKIKVLVKFENGSFNIHEIPGGYGFSDTAYPLGKLFLRDFGIEVIGNIYENLELLEGE